MINPVRAGREENELKTSETTRSGKEFPRGRELLPCEMNRVVGDSTIQTTSTQVNTRGREQFNSLPYDVFQVDVACEHSPFYIMQNVPEQPPFCGLCFFRSGWDSELPQRIHFFKTLAENGNPETSHKFMAHLFLVMGLKPPPKEMSLREFRRLRGEDKKRPAREQYTEVAWGLFPVASSLWKLMGFQPPLGIVLVKAVANGRTEIEIAKELDASVVNVHIRMAKAVRTAMGYIPRAEKKHPSPADSTRSDDESDAEQDGTDEPATHLS